MFASRGQCIWFMEMQINTPKLETTYISTVQSQLVQFLHYSYCVTSHCYTYRYICQMALIINTISFWSSQRLGMIQAVSHCSLISETQVSSQAFLYGICGGYISTGKPGSLCALVFTQSLSLCLHSTFIHPLPVLYNLKNWQNY